MAVTKSVKASKGPISVARGDLVVDDEVVSDGYGGSASMCTRKLNVAWSTSITCLKLWYGTKLLYAARQPTRKLINWSVIFVSMRCERLQATTVCVPEMIAHL